MSNETLKEINKLYPNKLYEPICINDLKKLDKKVYMVYILLFNDKPIVLGHGKWNRSKVIFDDLNTVTVGHIKSFFVRLYHLFGNGSFKRYIIKCDSKQKAQEIEFELHKVVEGNKRYIPKEISKKLFQDVEKNSTAELLIKIAINSSFSGLSDLRKWNSKGIISEQDWKLISDKLRLDECKKPAPNN